MNIFHRFSSGINYQTIKDQLCRKECHVIAEEKIMTHSFVVSREVKNSPEARLGFVLC